jgi:hypothetical protein
MKRDNRPRDRVGQVKCDQHGCKTRINPRTASGAYREFCAGCERRQMVDENIAAAKANTYKDRPRTGRRPK